VLTVGPSDVFKTDRKLWITQQGGQNRTSSSNQICFFFRAEFAPSPRVEYSNATTTQRSPPPALGPSLCSHRSKEPGARDPDDDAASMRFRDRIS
jgi:hypothetical protein